MKALLPVLLLAVAVTGSPLAAETTLRVEQSGVALSRGDLLLDVSVGGSAPGVAVPLVFTIAGKAVHRQELGPGQHLLQIKGADLAPGSHRILIEEGGGVSVSASLRVIPGWLSVVPPLLAIGLALAFREVLISLFLGVFSGALIIAHFNPFSAFARSIDQFMLGALADRDHASILLFTVCLGGMVGVISKSGGSHGIVQRLSSFANTARRGQLATWTMGIAIFFDDYANTLIVGSTMRPITDRLKISREKLAYVVDSTAAPVAAIFPISTWVGFEVGLIGDALKQVGLSDDYDGYTTFLASIPYGFYPIFALLMGFAIAWSGRDFGPMHRAESRARATGLLLEDGAVPLADYADGSLAPAEGVTPRARNAVVPILTVIVMTVVGLFVTGSAETTFPASASFLENIRTILSHADSYAALMWASLSGATAAIIMSLFQVRLKDSVLALVEGFKAMLLALVVLILAWSLGAVCQNLHTADFVVSLSQGILAPQWLPALVFVSSAAIAFATGTSWATMAILIPLVIPILHRLGEGAGMAPGSSQYSTLLFSSVASVLAGSVWGDHCSPISDTTILSSMSSGCDHIAHVRTQIPYAILAGGLAVGLGTIPTAFGLPVWISLLLGAGTIAAVVRWHAKPVMG